MPLTSRPLIACLLLLAAACSKGAPPPSQANEAAAADPAAANAASPDEATAPAAPGGGLDRSHHGETMPGAALQTLDGKPVSLAHIASGKALLVNLWATWCAPCVKELPTLDRLAATGTMRVAAVSQDLDGAAKVAPFLAKAGLKALPIYLDPKAAFSAGMGVNLPTSILYGADGKEVWRYTGDLDWTGPKAAALLAEGR